MFLPLTHERAWVRRIPVVSYAVVAITVLVLFSTSTSDERQHSDELMQVAVIYYLQNPDLVVDSRLVPVSEQVESFSTGEPSFSDELEDTVERQEQLDFLTDRWLASLETHPLWHYGLIPAEWSLSGLFTHMFLHADFWHWFGNIFLLYLTGPVVEDRLNRPAFLLLYLACGLVAGGAFAAQYPDLYRPLVGASGAIAGVLGAFLVLQWRTKIRFLVWIIIPLGTFSAPAWLMLPLWFLVELRSAVQQDLLAPGGAGGIAYWAHVWGFVFGTVTCWVAVRLGFDPGSERVTENKVLERVHLALERGRLKEAWRLLAEESEQRPTAADTTLAFWELAKDHDRVATAGPAMVALITDQARSGDPMFAAEQWYELGNQLPELALDVNVELTIVDRLSKKEMWTSAQLDLLRSVEQKLTASTPVGIKNRFMRLTKTVRQAPG